MENPQQKLAYDFVQFTNKNIFLTGKAGTGKTTFLHNLKAVSLKRMAIVAPTGVAAINAGGVTIHSFFQLPFGPYLPGSQNAQGHKKFNREKINLLQSLDLLVIDEISMVRADTLDGIDETLRRYKDHHKPFGGVQLLMIGDLHQLSPVVKDEDWRLLKDHYENLYFFGSNALKKTSPVTIELTHIYRQSDGFFIDLLNRIRENQIDVEVLKHLNQRFIPGFKPGDDEGYITLTTHNNAALEINQQKLKLIEKPSSFFKAVIANDFPEYSYPTVVDLELKIGSQVMFVKNDSSRDKLFYNGKIGKVTRINQEFIFVKCPADLLEIAVEPSEWQNIKYVLNPQTKEIEETILGTFTQYPLKLAWAITIHKSQGLTFEKAIIDANAAFAHGQVYVALSRCKSFEGMVLSSEIAFKSVKTDGIVSAYTKSANQNTPSEQQLNESKTAFQQSLLFELFDFNRLKSSFFQVKKLTEEHDNILPASLIETLGSIQSQCEKEVYAVADTFKKHLNLHLQDAAIPEDNLGLQERVKKASTYFLEKTSILLNESIPNLVIETDNKAVKKSITEALGNTKKELFIKVNCFKLCTEGFNTSLYLKTKANAEIDYSAIKTVAQTVSEPPSNLANALLHKTLNSWRNNLANQKNVPVYIILPQKALAEIVTKLPVTLAELELIKGIGKMKVKQYGNELLEIISTYCDDHNISQSPLELLPKKEKADTKKVSLDMWKSGQTLAEIAFVRGFSSSTIEGHLAHFIPTGEIDIFDIVSKPTVEKVEEYLKSNKSASLNEAKIALGDLVTYGELRAAMKYLQTINSETV